MMENEEFDEKIVDLDTSEVDDFVSSSNIDIPSSSIETTQLPSDMPNAQTTSQKEVVSDNKLKEKLDNNKNYQKSNSGKEAYKRTLNNKNYYNDKSLENAGKMQKNRLETKDNKAKRDNAAKRLEEAKNKKINSTGLRSKEDKNELKESKNEYKEQKKESKNLKKEERQLKKDKKNIQKDSIKSDAFKKMHPIQAVQMKLKKILVAKLLTIFVPIILGLALTIIVIEIILGPIMEAWGNIDEVITDVANFQEKIENFYNGFGFQDSKTAFYDEVDKLQRRYGDNLNIPLLFSTIFYTEGVGYDTNFGNMEAEDVIDKSVNSSGSNGGIWNSVKSYLSDKTFEAHNTVDENNLTYNVGKIYRLRKLARNQFHTNSFGVATREGEVIRVTLGDFIEMYVENISNDIHDLLSDISAVILDTILYPFRKLWSMIVGYESTDDFGDSQNFKYDDFADSLCTLVSDIFFGLTDVERVYYDVTKLKFMVEYKTFVFDKENYDKYLNDYYIENMPEFRSMLNGLTGNEREKKKLSIISDIYANENLFRDIFLQYNSESAEAYEDSCVGGINNSLVSKLQKPTDIASNYNVSFDSNTSFGLKGGVVHNGVDLNSTSTGNKAGDNVYAISSGTVEEIGGQSNSGSTGSSISNYLFLGDSRYEGIKEKLKALGSNNSVAAVSSSTPKQWEGVTSSGSGKVLNTQINLPSEASSVSVMLGVNSTDQDSNLKTVLTNLHNRYPNAQIYYNSTYHIGTKYTYGYVTNDAIDKLNEKMRQWCDETSWATYIDVTSNLYDSSGYLKADYSSDGLHINSTDGINQLVSNIKSGLVGQASAEFYANYIKIKHELKIDNDVYKFSSVYRNVNFENLNLKKGNTVQKGEKIGIIASSSDSHLHFEFLDETNKAIDPSNLFVSCSSSSEFAGSNNEEATYNYLVGKGYPKQAVAGIVSNMATESANTFDGRIVQGDVSGGGEVTEISKVYTKKVDDEDIKKYEFAHNGPNGGGYGIVQWTYPKYKEWLYDFIKGKDKNNSIGDTALQLDYLYEIFTNGEFKALHNRLMSPSITYDQATRDFMLNFERPANQSEAAQSGRVQRAKEIYERYGNK